MNKRSLYILNTLVASNEDVSVDSLAEYFEVSERTIYNDINEIELYLGEIDDVDLRQKGKNYYITIPDNEIYNLILEKIEEKSSELKEIDPLKRVDYQIFLMLINNQEITIKELADILKLSSSTIKSDRLKVIDKLSKFNLELETIKFKGSKILGTEENIRDLLIRLVLSDFKIEKFNDIDNIYLRNIDMKKMECANELIKFVSETLNINYVDKYLLYIRVSLLISFMRIDNNHTIENKPQITDMTFSKEYEIVNQYLTGKFPDYVTREKIINEMTYLSSKFKKSSYYSNELNLYSDNWIYYQFLIRELIEDISNELSINLTMDNDLYTGLYQHLRPAVYRLKNKINFENPLRNEVMEKYPKLYIKIRKHLQDFEKIFKIKFNSDEITYVVLLFASSIEDRLDKFQIKPTIAVICQEGISTAAILKSKLNKNFDMTIVGTYSKNYFLKIQSTLNVDFVVSTVDLFESQINYVKVTPLINNEDKKKLRKYLDDKQTSVDIRSFIKEIEPYISIKGYSGLSNKLNLLLNSRTETKNIIGGKILLNDVISNDLIKVNTKVNDAKEAVITSGKLLLNKNLIEEKYIDGMLNNLKENGPYFVIAPGIAMPHARPEDGANDIGISITTLEHPVEFGHPKNDPVKIVIGLCAVDHQSHLTALAELIDILSDKKSVQKIEDANTSEEILKIVRGE